MFVKERGAPIPRSAIDDYTGRLEDLLAAMAMVRKHGRPTREILDAAPLLDAWTVQPMIEMCLAGRVHGHPKLPGSGRPIATSQLVLLAPDEAWALTHSRYYKLGRRAAETAQ